MSTLEELKKLIHTSFGIDPETLKPEALLSDYGLDSLSLAELLFAVEEHFDLSFPDDRLDIKSLDGLSSLIDQLRLAKAA